MCIMTCHQRGRPTWNDDIAAFVPGGTARGHGVAGAANGDLSTAGALDMGAKAAQTRLGIKGRCPKMPQAEDAPVNITPFWYVEGAAARGSTSKTM